MANNICNLYDYKQSDTIVVYGCGSSINSLTPPNKDELSLYDSISFNWFCFSEIPTTYYLIREQANIPKRRYGEENVDNFINHINDYYNKSCLIIHDISHHSPKAFNYAEHLDEFNGDCVVVKDIKLNNNNSGVKWWSENERGLIHGKCTMNNVLHFIVQMRYKRVIFVGVDLYDSKYFWVEKGHTRYAVKNKNRNYKSKHFIANTTLNIIKGMRDNYDDIKLYTYNSKSLLKKIIPPWEKRKIYCA